jgi:phospholipase C
VYTRIKNNPKMWASTALLVVYDEHGGIFDHVTPPPCKPDKFHSSQVDPGTGQPFQFDRLGVRVPAILVSPWIPKGTLVDRVFDHASIPATISKFFLGGYPDASPREANADVFIEPNNGQGNLANNLLSLDVMRDDCPDFKMR